MPINIINGTIIEVKHNDPGRNNNKYERRQPKRTGKKYNLYKNRQMIRPKNI